MEAAATGYLHELYAESFADLGRPRYLARAKGWLIERAIPGTTARDAMGCYPLFCCREWSALADDLDALAGELVSVALVTDPFGGFVDADLHRAFDAVTPFKQHVVVDLTVPIGESASVHHRKHARRALKAMTIEECRQPLEHIDEWLQLYDLLRERHQIGGVRNFSAAALRTQLQVPGLRMFRAFADSMLLGLHLWYVQGDVAYGHLGVTTNQHDAAYGLYWRALETFASDVRWAALGAAAGVATKAGGLDFFKRGWSDRTRPVMFCRRVFAPAQYEELSRAAGHSHSTTFPAYRSGEFS